MESKESKKNKESKDGAETQKSKDTAESKDGKQSDICPICQEEFKDTTVIKTLACTHKFHVECIQKWIEMRNLCPLCNKVADTSRPVRELRDDRQDLSQQMIQNLLSGSMNSTGLNFWVDLLQGRGGILTPMRYWGFPRLQEYLNLLDDDVDDRMRFDDSRMQFDDSRIQFGEWWDAIWGQQTQVDDRTQVDDEIYIPPQFFSVEEFNVHPDRIFSSPPFDSVRNVLQSGRSTLMNRFLEQFSSPLRSSIEPIPEHKLMQEYIPNPGHNIPSSRQFSRFTPYRRSPNPHRVDQPGHPRQQSQQSDYPRQQSDHPDQADQPTFIEQSEQGADQEESTHSHVSCHEKAQCANCYEIQCVHVIKRCGKCKQVRYCSRECQEQDWSKHKTWCLAHSTT
jgi:hypothetical protein